MYKLDDGTIHSATSWDMTKIIGLQSQVSLHAFRKFRGVVREIESDLIHLYNRFFFTTFIVISWKLVSERDIPIVTTFHLGDTGDIGDLGGRAARLYDHR